MSDIVKGDTFVDGQSVTGARLNNLVDLAVIQAAFISGKAQVTPVGTDYLIIYQTSSGQLKKALVSALTFVTSVGLALPTNEFNISGSPVTGAGTLTGAWKNQNQNKVFAAPADGTNGTPTFRALTPKDQTVITQAVAANDIDWSLGQTFSKSISGVFTPTFSNAVNGQTIRLAVTQAGGGNVVWSIASLQWPSAAIPVTTTIAGRIDFYEFTKVGTNFIGRYFLDCH